LLAEINNNQQCTLKGVFPQTIYCLDSFW